MVALEALSFDYNRSIINEAEFYVGMFMLLSRTESMHLLPDLIGVLPLSWQAEDLTWLHQAAEAQYNDKVTWRSSSPDRRENNQEEDVVEGVSSSANANSLSNSLSNALEDHLLEPAEHIPLPSDDLPPPAKRMKKQPTNGFRTSNPVTDPDLQPKFVDPAALLIYQPVIEPMPDSDEASEARVTAAQPSKKGLVKLKLKKSKPATPSHKTLTKAKKASDAVQTSESHGYIDGPAISTDSGQTVKSKSFDRRLSDRHCSFVPSQKVLRAPLTIYQKLHKPCYRARVV